MEKPKSVEAYFAGLSDEARSALQKLRETIAAAAPEAEEGIAYRVGVQGRRPRPPGLVVETRLAEVAAKRR